jgi:hypothetical protein
MVLRGKLPRFRTYYDELHYAEDEVKSLLKAGNRYLAFHGLWEIEKLQAKSQCIFETQLRPSV